MKKQIRALVLAMLFALTLLPASGFAADVTNEAGLAVALTAGGTVTLGGDITVNTMIEIPAGVTVTLDLNGHDILGAFNGSSTTNHIYAISNRGNLTVKDTVGGGEIISRGIYNYSTMTLESGTINACDGNGGYAVNNESGSTFTMNGGSIIAEYDDDPTAFTTGDPTTLDVPAGCTATINGGTISCASNWCYAISAAGTLNITNSKGTVQVEGAHGAVAVSGSGVATIDGGTFVCTGAEGVSSDHVLYASGTGKFVVKGGSFTNNNNDNASNGVAICLNSENASAELKGGSFDGVDAPFYGHANLTITGGTYESSRGGVSAWTDLEDYVPDGCEFDPATGTVTDPSAAAVYAGPAMNWVKVNAADNGVVKSGPLAASAGSTITLYPKAAEGYALDTVTVLDAEGNTVKLDGLKFAVPAGGVTVSATFKPAQ